MLAAPDPLRSLSVTLTWDVPGVLYVGGGTALYRSHDCSGTWEAVPLPSDMTDRDGQPRTTPQVSTAPGGRIYAGGDYDGPATSGDGGQAWELVNGSRTRRLVASPAEPRVVYGVFWSALPSGMFGMYRSDDAGATWHLLDFRRAGTPFAVDPADPSLVYFWDDRQVFATRDLLHGPGEPEIRTFGTFPAGVTAAAMSPDGAVFWDATEARTWHRSADGGEMWRALDAAPAERPFVSLGVDPNDSAVVFGTTDDGELWVYRDAELASAG